MKNLLILVMVLILSPLRSQEANIFTYPEFDEQLIRLWVVAERGEIKDLSKAALDLQRVWDLASDEIVSKQLRHFKVQDFVLEQDLIIAQMDSHLAAGEVEQIGAKSYKVLQNFQEVRTYFTSDLYPLDELLFAFSIYDELNQVVNDPMLGLYEWNQIIRLFSDFKKQFERYVVMAEPGFSSDHHVLFKLGVQRVFDCSEDFEASLRMAQQPDFIPPCDDTRDALIELVSLHGHVGVNL